MTNVKFRPHCKVLTLNTCCAYFTDIKDALQHDHNSY